MSEIVPILSGYGYAVPSKIRGNNDPIFQWLHDHRVIGENLFEGYKERRVLDAGEDLMTIMLPASRNAMKDAGIQPGEVDFLLGVGSISLYRNPNVLSDLHNQLKLGENCWPIPISDSFSNFNSSLLIADSLIRAGRANHILICIGGNWTRNVDYHTPQAISAADGAGAVVVSRDAPGKDSWTVVDSLTVTDSDYYGSMYTSGAEYQLELPNTGPVRLWSDHYFHITAKGIDGFKKFGVHEPARCVNTLLKKHHLDGSDVCLISHQASDKLIKAWNDSIKPGQYINTIETFANMALANVPVNLAWSREHEPIQKSYLVLLTIGPDMHTNALLLKRVRA
jgi:3-oxoacyl-[acyl-carrier-protein] synthase-3